VVSFTPSRFTPQGESPWYPLDRRLTNWICLIKSVIAYNIFVENHQERDHWESTGVDGKILE
jgi:hypothetical protein